MFAQTLVQIASAIAGQFRHRTLVSLPLSLAALCCLLLLPALTPPALAQNADSAYLYSIGRANTLKSPRDLAVDSAGNIYVVNGGQLSHPEARTVIANGVTTQQAVDVVDHAGVQVFDSNGILHPNDQDPHGGFALLDSDSDDGAAGIAIDNTDGVYICKWNGIDKYDSAGNLILHFANSATAYRAAIDGSGNVIALTYYSGIRKFDSAGNYLGQFNNYSDARSIATDSAGNVYVVNSDNQIVVFDSAGNQISQFGSSGSNPGQLQYVTGVAVDSGGVVYVADSYRIQKFDQSGNYAGLFYTSQDGFLGGIKIDNAGNVYVLNSSIGEVVKIDSNGNVALTAGAPGNGQLYTAKYAAFSASGYLYVADYQNHRVQVFAPDGSYAFQFGGQGNGNGKFLGPNGVAVDNATGKVYVADSANSRIQVFDLNGNYVSQFSVDPQNEHLGPHGIALDGLGHLYVACVGSTNDRIQVFDLSGNYISQFGSTGNGDGQFQYKLGIAIANNHVYVADEARGDVQIFSLNGDYLSKFRGIYSAVGQQFGASGIAADNNGRLYVTGAYYDSGGFVQRFGSDGSYIDQLGRSGGAPHPKGVAVDAQGKVYVIHENYINVFSASIVVNSDNPVPSLTSVTPNQAIAGDPDMVISVNGSGFVSSSTVLLDGGALATTYVSPGEMTAVIPASQLAVAGSHSITVASPTPGGGISAALPFTVVNPAPQLITLTPDHAAINSPDTAISLTGTGFFSGSIVKFGATALATTFISSTQLTAVIPAASLTTVASTNVTVTNPAPGGGVSNALPFATTVNPVPALNSLTPSQVIAGSPDTTIMLSGSGFVPASVAKFGTVSLTTTYVSSTQLTALVPAAKLTTAGRVNVTVANPKPGGGVSKSRTFTVANPTPTLTNITPDEALAGSGNTIITLTGTGFTATSKALFSGSMLTTAYVSATTLTAVIPAIKMTKAGDFDITVSNPTPGGGTSGSLTFTVSNPAPTLTGITPSQATENATGVIITLNGSGFVSGAKVTFGGTALTTTFVSSTQLKATVSSTLLKPGVYDVVVTNPAPGGGDSVALPFTVNMGATTLTLISSPAPTVTKSGGVLTIRATLKNPGSYDARNVRVTTATLNGTASATINPSGTITITKGASTVITLTFPASAAASGSYPTLSLTYTSGNAGSGNLTVTTGKVP